MTEFNDILNKAAHLYDELTGDRYPLHRRGHHEFCTDLMHEYEISVKLLPNKKWFASCATFGTIGEGEGALSAVFASFISHKHGQTGIVIHEES